MIGCQSKSTLICMKKVCFILQKRILQILSAKVGSVTNSIEQRYEIFRNYTIPCKDLKSLLSVLSQVDN